MKSILLIFFIFSPSIVMSWQVIPHSNSSIYEIEIYKDCDKKTLDCSSEFVLQFHDKVSYLSFYTYTQGHDACEKYIDILEQLNDEDLFRFLNKGIALLEEDFGTQNVAHWQDIVFRMEKQNVSYEESLYTYNALCTREFKYSLAPIIFNSTGMGMNRVRSTLFLLKLIYQSPGTSFKERFDNFKEKLIIDQKDQLNHIELDRLLKAINWHLSMLTVKNMPFVSFKADLETQGGLSGEAPMIEELLGIVDKPHWLLGQKQLLCRFTITVYYLLSFSPPAFEHDIAFGITAYCGDKRIPKKDWKRKELLTEKYMHWKTKLIKRILTLYKSARTNDPFIRDQRFLVDKNEYRKMIGSIDIKLCDLIANWVHQ